MRRLTAALATLLLASTGLAKGNGSWIGRDDDRASPSKTGSSNRRRQVGSAGTLSSPGGATRSLAAGSERTQGRSAPRAQPKKGLSRWPRFQLPHRELVRLASTLLPEVEPGTRILIDHHDLYRFSGDNLGLAEAKVLRLEHPDGRVEEVDPKAFGRHLGKRIAQQGKTGTRHPIRNRLREALDKHPTDITSRPAEAVMRQLGLGRDDVASLAGKSVISVGEGFSSFAQHLEAQGARVAAVDLLYAKPRHELKDLLIQGGPSGKSVEKPLSVDEALARLPQHRIGANATALPLASGSADRVFDANLFYWLSPQQQLKAVREYLRVLKPGGQARIVGLAKDSTLVRFMQSRWPQVQIAFPEGGPTILTKGP